MLYLRFTDLHDNKYHIEIRSEDEVDGWMESKQFISGRRGSTEQVYEVAVDHIVNYSINEDPYLFL